MIANNITMLYDIETRLPEIQYLTAYASRIHLMVPLNFYHSPRLFTSLPSSKPATCSSLSICQFNLPIGWDEPRLLYPHEMRSLEFCQLSIELYHLSNTTNEEVRVVVTRTTWVSSTQVVSPAGGLNLESSLSYHSKRQT